mmetsp:Transcript_7923/g.11999  ORF Transcript_7923/g.11999 Transcript_7923/m.11999 type:complete len:92 (+) Transcript_7923:107-382(+)
MESNSQNVSHPPQLRNAKISHQCPTKLQCNRTKPYCEKESCNALSTFGFPYEIRRFCGKHKLVGMIDLKSKRCEFKGCLIIPSFGYEGFVR